MGKKEGHEGGGNQINKSRSCTDILCILLFIVFIGGWVGVGVIGFMSGDPEQLVFPSNSQGEICGRGDYQDKPALFFHDPIKCVSVTAVFGCSTPQVSDIDSDWLIIQLLIGSGLCQGVSTEDDIFVCLCSLAEQWTW